MTATLVYTAGTSSTREENNLRIARVAAAGRVQAARLAERRRFLGTGQAHWEDMDYCYICSRATDHTGEHTPEQIARWREGRAVSARVAS